MKIKRFRSILAVAVVVASITTSLSPAQAFTWEDAWNAIKRGYENAPSSNSPQQSNNETPQADPQTNNNNIESSSIPSFKCVKVDGEGSYAIGQDESESTVSVGRNALKVWGKVYISPRTPYGETCSVEVHPSDEKIRLAFAIPDNSNLDNMRISIYVDGQQRISKIISRSQVGRYTIDITGANSYAYTLQPLNGDGRVYFPY
jgi:hypothetical protein